MKLRYEKGVRVMNDILGYCRLIGGRHFHVDFELLDKSTEITIRCAVPDVTDKQLRNMDKLLNMPRQHEVEQNYWEIGGEVEEDNELSLAGMMTDEARVDYTDGVLTIFVLRLDSYDTA